MASMFCKFVLWSCRFSKLQIMRDVEWFVLVPCCSLMFLIVVYDPLFINEDSASQVRLEEDPDLHLPFLLPEDGYSCDTIRGIPNGLPEFVSQLGASGLCQLFTNPNASGSWTVHMSNGLPQNYPPPVSRYMEPIVLL